MITSARCAGAIPPSSDFARFAHFHAAGNTLGGHTFGAAFDVGKLYAFRPEGSGGREPWRNQQDKGNKYEPNHCSLL